MTIPDRTSQWGLKEVAGEGRKPPGSGLSSATAKPGECGTPTLAFQEQQC